MKVTKWEEGKQAILSRSWCGDDDVHKSVDFVYKCQKYNQRELQRLVTGHHLIYGMDFSILVIVIFLTHHGPSARHCRLKLLQRQMTAIPCSRLRWPVFLIRSLHAYSSIARRQVRFVFRVSFVFRWRRRYLLTWKYECSSWIKSSGPWLHWAGTLDRSDWRLADEDDGHALDHDPSCHLTTSDQLSLTPAL